MGTVTTKAHLRALARQPAAGQQGLGYLLQTKVLGFVAETPFLRDPLVSLLLGIERSKAGVPPS